MKNTLVLFPLFAIGVFGADEVKSVKEGDSVTLNTGVQIQANDDIEWRFNGKLIFRVRSSASAEISVSDFTDGPFRGRLQVDKPTGDLKITNTKTTDAGEYLLTISTTRGSSDTKFSVTVVPGSDSALGPGAIAGIVIGVLAGVAAVVGGIYYGYSKKAQML